MGLLESGKGGRGASEASWLPCVPLAQGSASDPHLLQEEMQHPHQDPQASSLCSTGLAPKPARTNSV